MNRNDDDRWMTLALRDADRMLGKTAPNPAVGCVLVKENRLIGRGATQAGGRPHAEQVAIEQAKQAGHITNHYATDGATAYVTLEPCAHHGETSPCATRLIEAGIARVVIALKDPDPRVDGRGIDQLKAAGINVETGLMEAAAQTLNLGFILSRQPNPRPLITLKLATTLDGKIALKNHKSQWITNHLCRQHGHLLRARHDAILIGAGTLRMDDPELTCRIEGLEADSPRPIIVQGKNPLPESSRLLSKHNPIILYPETHDYCDQYPEQLTKIALPILQDGEVDMHPALEQLSQQGITRLLVEGGQAILTSFMRYKLVDWLVHYRAPNMIGEDGIAAIGPLGLSTLIDMPEFQPVKRLNFGEHHVDYYCMAEKLENTHGLTV